MTQHKLMIGCEEWCALPALDVPAIQAKVDSGANISAIHTFNVCTFFQDNKEYVTFYIYPLRGTRKIKIACNAELYGRKDVKSSNGIVEKRLVILTPVKLGKYVWNIELTLTNRDAMGYRMLLGREAMRDHVLVDPNRSFLTEKLEDIALSKLYSKPMLVSKPSLNIVLLASNPHLYSNKKIMEAGLVCGHNMRFLNIRDCYIHIKASVPTIYYRGGEEISNIDAVIPRLRPALTFYGCALLRQFRALGAFCLNDDSAIVDSRNKLKCLQILAEKGIDMPVTTFASSLRSSKHLISIVGGTPLIVKVLEGTQGRGVVLVENHKAAESVISAFKSTKTNVLVQEFIKEAYGKDIRCFVVDGKVVASMQREATDGDFRANLHLGGVGFAIKLTKQERKMAVNAAKIIGLKVAGVDMIRSNTGPKVLEVNSSPGLEGIERVVKINIAQTMIECVEKYIYGSENKFIS
ncbi:putative alpha-L-glutamate ligase [Alphaproteobacteria bacterium]